MLNFQNNLKKYREMSNLTQSELGLLTGVCQSHIGRLEAKESASPSIELLTNIFKVLHDSLGITMEDLLYGVDKEGADG